MLTFDLLQFAAVAFAVYGLVAVIWEIATKSPRSFAEIARDTRAFATRPAPPAIARDEAPASAAPADRARLSA